MKRGTVNHENGFVAFLDILGFKEMVSSSDNHDKEKLNKYLTISEEILKYKNENGYEMIHSILINDSIILKIPHGNDLHTTRKNLNELCSLVAFIQCTLAIYDIWMSGSIYIFDQHELKKEFKNKAFFRPSCLLYPRVILEDNLLDFLAFEDHYEMISTLNSFENKGLHKNVLFCWKKHDISFDEEAPLFIDYIDPLISDQTNNALKVIDMQVEKNKYQSSSEIDFEWLHEYVSSKKNF